MRAVAHLRQLSDRHPLLVDVALAGATAAVSLVLGRQDPPEQFRELDGVGYALTCLVNATLVARRRAPSSVLLLYCTLWVGYIATGYWPVVNSAGALLALYTVAAHRPSRISVTAAVVVATVWLYGGLALGAGFAWAALAQSVVWTAVVWHFGNRAQQLAERNRRLAVLAERLRRDREERARRAVTEERVHIARELHDVVAHHMSVISVQAGLARYVLESDPVTSRTALETVLRTSGEALREMRRVLAVLHVDADEVDGAPDGETYQPSPGIDRLDELVERVRGAGVPVEVVVVGVPRPLAAGLDLCAYRVIQECLTNVLRHAGPTCATVTLHYDADRFVVRVSDAGRGMAESRDDAKPGHGLIGMRERARVYGGTLVTGSRPHGGFEVLLTLPTPAAEAEWAEPGEGRA
ncbi:sensor histidine kinase [Micromonospora sp. C51]|uniref:sensor histidine kinase n=1 Tax=Micromonospora sp. C51 TaxID=2824879 RepID=UPI001B36F809|nr:histidine kinase [Micromonospora sp. C51]MBQ1049208.1 sensor histidine kinase [Micromonospora sp. C51]